MSLIGEKSVEMGEIEIRPNSNRSDRVYGYTSREVVTQRDKCGDYSETE